MLRTIVSFVCSLCILFQSCKTDTAKVSEEEALATAKKLEGMVNSRDVEGVVAFFDMRTFFALLSIKSRAAEDPTVMKGFKSTFSMVPFAEAVVQAADSGYFRFLRHYEKDGQQRLLFRFISSSGVNYHDYYLTKVKNVVKAEDVLIYSTGESLTTTIADALDEVLPHDSDIDVAKRLADSLLLIKKMREKRDYEGVKRVYEGMPPTLQQTKGFLMVYMEACKKTDPVKYAAALEKQAQWFRITPATYLHLIDASVRIKDYEKALFAINKIDEITGGDPFLDYFRAGVNQRMGKIAEGKVFLEKVYAYDPAITMNLVALVGAYVTDNETDKAQKILAAYKVSKGFDQKALDALYENFPVLRK